MLFYGIDRKELHREAFERTFRHPVGIRSGMDPDGRHYNRYLKLGFGFATVGPVSCAPHSGIRHIIDLFQENAPTGPVFVDIVKQTHSTTEEAIAHDYLSTFASAYDFATLFLLDFSIRNTGAVLEPSFIKDVSDPVLDARLSYENYRPVVLRLHRELPLRSLEDILDYCRMNGVDGVAVDGLDALKNVHRITQGRYPVIATDRIRSAADVAVLLREGASLVELDCRGPEVKGLLRGRKILKDLKINE
ncbi:MAG: hypothetical protein IJV01_05230 [Bacteroidales bacterium]|nr:hypothetical protein [Bacteroidales bacterium]